MVRVRDAKPEELAPKPRTPRALTPRQLAIKRREQLIEKTLNELGAGSASAIKKVELEDNEKLFTIRTAIAKQIKASVEQLGFNLVDTKILTATHGHFDHVAGLAELKRMTGARLVVSEPDKELFESGGRLDFRFGDTPGARFEPAKVDGTFKDSDIISLGGTVLTAHHHPGHTKGATSFTLNVQESGKTYRVVIANMGSINPGVTVSGMAKYPGIAEDYARTFKAQKDMQIDVWLASHASQFKLHEKYKPGDAFNPERFVDPQGFKASVEQLEKRYLEQLARERAVK